MLNIYHKKVNVKTEIEPNLFIQTAKVYNTAIDEVFGKVEYGKPDYDFVQELKYNNYVFSAIKTHRQQNDLNAELVGKDGKLKTFAQFKTDVKAIDRKYNNDWLNTEYNTAVLRARMAAQFKKFERDADLFPNLKWLPSTSVEKRPYHVPFYGTIKPINDAFWKNNFPGNLWNCKCGITNTDEDIKNPVGNNNTKNNADNGLDENPAFTAKIYSNSHPYVTNAYISKDKLITLAQSYADKFAYKPILIKQYKNGGKLYESNLVDKKASDYEDVKLVADYFAKEGHSTEILPKLHFKHEKYKQLFDGAYQNKCPDIKVDTNFYELESFSGIWNKSKVSNMLSRGFKQSDRIIIDIRNGHANNDFIKRMMFDMIKHKIKITELWILNEKGIHQIY